ncbi:MAG: macrolide 2'-phosphotransferase [Propionibacteriaceae bacterium]
MSTTPDGQPHLDAVTVELGRRHGLDLIHESLQHNEMGLDFRVTMARTTAGEEWVLRVPRRPDVMDRAETEAAVLALVRPVLKAAVPDWQIHSRELIAYPLLPGRPGVTLDSTGSPVWHLDPSSLGYAESLGELVGQLQSVSTEAAESADIPVFSPEEVRSRWQRDLDRVGAEFTIAPTSRRRWQAWIDDDSFWPSWSALSHGEIYPAHTLLDDRDQIVGVLDWTTAEVGDPARDLTLQHSASSGEAFAATLDRYRAGGGRPWPRLAEHCSEIHSAGALGYGSYALLTGEAAHREAAAAMLAAEIETDEATG